MAQFQLQLHRHLQTLPQKPPYFHSSQKLLPLSHHSTFPYHFLPNSQKPTNLRLPLRRILPATARSPPLVCKSNGLDLEVLSEAEDRGKPHRRANGIFWILLVNLGIYLADHVFKVRAIKMLYLYHNWPTWYQFLTATFCHANWNHLSSNLFFLYIFGKLVEEEEGNFALWLCYILTGVGANLVSWLVLPSNAVSVGASGAVFGLFTISVLVKMSWDWRKILEVLILGQFVIEKVMEAAQASTALSGNFGGGHSLMNVNHIAHLSGALVGVFLVWILSKVPSEPPGQGSKSQSKTDRTGL